MKTISLTLKYVFLAILAFISIFPFVWMILGMTNQTFDIVAGKIMIGDQLVINFQNLFSSDLNFTRALSNSAVIAVITTSLRCCSPPWRGMALRFIGRKPKTASLIFSCCR